MSWRASGIREVQKAGLVHLDSLPAATREPEAATREPEAAEEDHLLASSPNLTSQAAALGQEAALSSGKQRSESKWLSPEAAGPAIISFSDAQDSLYRCC